MFSNNFRYSITKTEKYSKELALTKLPITENRIVKLLLVLFYCCFCLGRWLKNYAFSLGQITISQPILKIMNSNPHIYRSSVTNYFHFGRYFNNSIRFIKCVKKANFFKGSSKMEKYCQKS